MKCCKTAGEHSTETDLLKVAWENIQKRSIHVTVIGNFRMKTVTVDRLNH